jgi:hypothetical protein
VQVRLRAVPLSHLIFIYLVVVRESFLALRVLEDNIGGPPI